ncbi:MAG TPA: lysophospholipid acyltransferase family protein, partial [Kofleriaceae bacterium]
MTGLLAAPFHDAGHGYDVFGLRPQTLARAVAIGRVLHDSYFRVSSHGIENVPASGPTIVIANHGGVLPIDAAMLCLDLLLRTDPPRIPRPLADHFVASLPIVGTLFARVGVVMGTRGNARRLLERGELLAIWPEGVSGPAKPFSHRYELQAWSTGFAELALRYHAKGCDRPDPHHRDLGGAGQHCRGADDADDDAVAKRARGIALREHDGHRDGDHQGGVEAGPEPEEGAGDGAREDEGVEPVQGEERRADDEPAPGAGSAAEEVAGEAE